MYPQIGSALKEFSQQLLNTKEVCFHLGVCVLVYKYCTVVHVYIFMTTQLAYFVMTTQLALSRRHGNTAGTHVVSTVQYVDVMYV